MLISLNRSVNPWRIFEKEAAKKYFGEVQDFELNRLKDLVLKDNINALRWFPHTEDTSFELFNVMKKRYFNCFDKQIFHINPPEGFINAHLKDSAFSVWDRI